MWEKRNAWKVTAFFVQEDSEGESVWIGDNNSDDFYADSYEEAVKMKEMLLAGEDPFYGDLVEDVYISDEPEEHEFWVLDKKEPEKEASMDDEKKEEFHKFIADSLDSKTNFRAFTLSETIPGRLANAIKEILGVDVSDYQNEIYESIVRHIEKRHGEHGEADHSMADMRKLDRINDFMENFDQVKEAKENKLFKNSDGSHSKTIEISKNYNNESGILIEAVPQNNRKSLETITMYYKKIEDSAQVPDVKSPGITSKTELAYSKSSIQSINQSDKSVNTKIKEDLIKNDFVPTKSLVEKMEKLNQVTGTEHSISDINKIYRSFDNEEVHNLVNDIANECKDQEQDRRNRGQGEAGESGGSVIKDNLPE